MSKVTGMRGMANNVVYARNEIAPGTYIWAGDREVDGRGHVATYPSFKMVTFSDNDNARFFLRPVK